MAYADKVRADGILRDIHDTAARGMIAPIEETDIAAQAYSSGTYFIYNDILYKATANIAVGDQIIPNTNCEQTTVMAEIASLHSN